MPAHLRAQHRGQRRRVRDDRGGRMIGGRVGRQAPEPVVEQRVRLRVRLRRQPERHRAPVEPGHPALEPEERRAQACRDARVPAEHVGRGGGGMAAAVLPDVLGGDVALPAGDERGVDVRAAGPARARRRRARRADRTPRPGVRRSRPTASCPSPGQEVGQVGRAEHGGRAARSAGRSVHDGPSGRRGGCRECPGRDHSLTVRPVSPVSPGERQACNASEFGDDHPLRLFAITMWSTQLRTHVPDCVVNSLSSATFLPTLEKVPVSTFCTWCRVLCPMLCRIGALLPPSLQLLVPGMRDDRCGRRPRCGRADPTRENSCRCEGCFPLAIVTDLFLFSVDWMRFCSSPEESPAHGVILTVRANPLIE